MTSAEKELAEELFQLAACVGSPHVTWANGFTVRKPKDLGRSPEGKLLRRLYSLSLRVRGRRPFDIGELSGRAGQSVHEWLESGISAFERWLGFSEHGADEAKDTELEGRHRSEGSRDEGTAA